MRTHRQQLVRIRPTSFRHSLASLVVAFVISVLLLACVLIFLRRYNAEPTTCAAAPIIAGRRVAGAAPGAGCCRSNEDDAEDDCHRLHHHRRSRKLLRQWVSFDDRCSPSWATATEERRKSPAAAGGGSTSRVHASDRRRGRQGPRPSSSALSLQLPRTGSVRLPCGSTIELRGGAIVSVAASAASAGALAAGGSAAADDVARDLIIAVGTPFPASPLPAVEVKRRLSDGHGDFLQLAEGESARRTPKKRAPRLSLDSDDASGGDSGGDNDAAGRRTEQRRGSSEPPAPQTPPASNASGVSSHHDAPAWGVHVKPIVSERKTASPAPPSLSPPEPPGGTSSPFPPLAPTTPPRPSSGACTPASPRWRLSAEAIAATTLEHAVAAVPPARTGLSHGSSPQESSAAAPRRAQRGRRSSLPDLRPEPRPVPPQRWSVPAAKPWLGEEDAVGFGSSGGRGSGRGGACRRASSPEMESETEGLRAALAERLLLLRGRKASGVALVPVV